MTPHPYRVVVTHRTANDKPPDRRTFQYIKWRRGVLDGEKEWIVDKITAKRIYIRVKGDHRSVYYTRETGAGTSKYDGVIDLEATFPEGVS